MEFKRRIFTSKSTKIFNYWKQKFKLLKKILTTISYKNKEKNKLAKKHQEWEWLLEIKKNNKKTGMEKKSKRPRRSLRLRRKKKKILYKLNQEQT